MKYRKFTLTTFLYDEKDVSKENHIDTLNELCIKENWRVVTSLYTVGNTSILLLEKTK